MSSAAKSLVNSILEHDPEARPSLDDVANHRFFKSGFFPRSIPSSATKQEPIWRGTTGQGVGTLTTNREDWIRNYEEVARICGIGKISEGRYSPVGDHPGEVVDLLTLPTSRPASAASNQNNKVPEKVEAVEEDVEKKKSAKEKAYLLPETLSPRDGHARMRGVGVLKKIPSILGPSRGGLLGSGSIAAQKPMDDVEEEDEEVEEEEEEVSEDEEPARPPPRQLRQQPIRRSAAIAAAAAAAAAATAATTSTADAPAPAPAPAPARSVFPARRGLVRSHAAEMRAACAGLEADKPIPPPPPPPPTMAALPKKQTTLEARPERPVSSAEFREKAPKEDVKEPASESTGPVIPFTPVLNSKIGNSIPSTTTSAIIASLQPYIQNFSAFTAGKLHLLPPQPPATIEAVRSFKRGEKNTCLFITKWVDYTNKYGVAYILTDGTCVAMYNDNTSLVVDSVGGQRVEFITQSIVDVPTSRRNNKQEVTYRRLSTTMTVMNQKKKSSRGLASKVTMWKRFGNYMKTNLGSEAEWSFTRERDHSEQSAQDPEGGMIFVTHYARLRRCAMFRFSDGGFQVGLHLGCLPGIY